MLFTNFAVIVEIAQYLVDKLDTRSQTRFYKHLFMNATVVLSCEFGSQSREWNIFIPLWKRDKSSHQQVSKVEGKVMN